MDNAHLYRASGPAPKTNVEHFVPAETVCPKEINFVVDNGNIDYISFDGGCEGSLTAIASMIEGMHVDFVIDRFSGITCGNKCTSCVDQLCCALRKYKEENEDA